MKKSYLMIAAAAALFAACSSNDIKNDVKNYAESPINFSTFTTRQTKADNSNQDATWDLEDHSTSFYVWSWKKYEGAWVTPAVFNKTGVNYTTAWNTEESKYWDKSADSYYFYAAAPKDAKWTLNNNSTADNYGDDYLTYADFTLTGTNLSTSSVTTYQNSFKNVGDVDLMIAEDNEILRTVFNVTNPPAVNEIFDHVLSRLNVTVKRGAQLEAGNATVKLVEFAITGVNLNNKGSFTENAASGSTLKNGTTARWNGYDIANGPYNLAGAIPTANIEGTALYICQYLIIPQTITSEVLDRATGKNGANNPAHPYFKIKYTIDDEPYTAYYNLANAFNIAGGSTLAFCEGYQNNLNIIIDADVITFDPVVRQWDNKTTYEQTIK